MISTAVPTTFVTSFGTSFEYFFMISETSLNPSSPFPPNAKSRVLMASARRFLPPPSNQAVVKLPRDGGDDDGAIATHPMMFHPLLPTKRAFYNPLSGVVRGLLLKLVVRIVRIVVVVRVVVVVVVISQRYSSSSSSFSR